MKDNFILSLELIRNKLEDTKKYFKKIELSEYKIYQESLNELNSLLSAATSQDEIDHLLKQIYSLKERRNLQNDIFITKLNHIAREIFSIDEEIFWIDEQVQLITEERALSH